MGWGKRSWGKKFNNKKTVIDGHEFDSLMEAARYRQLKLLLHSGDIRGLKLQPPFTIVQDYQRPGESTKSGLRKIPKTEFVADFRYIEAETGYEIIEDVKGHKTAEFNLKRKLFEIQYIVENYPHIQFRLITKDMI